VRDRTKWRESNSVIIDCQSIGTGNDTPEHRVREPPGLGVVSAAMIRIDKVPAIRELVFNVVSKYILCLTKIQGLEDSPMGNVPQRQDDSLRRNLLQLGAQKAIAHANFLRSWLILRREALHGIRDSATNEFETVLTADRLSQTGKSILMQGAVKENPGKVTGKWTPGSVRAMQPGRKPNDQQPCPGVAKGRNRMCIVARMSFADMSEMASQPRAVHAMDIKVGHETPVVKPALMKGTLSKYYR